jgi:methanogenic corrinoid protein MtbC1
MTPDIETLTRSLECAIEAGDETEAPRLAQALLDLGVPPAHLTAALSRAMSRLGEQFQRLDIFVPDLLIAADAFEAVMQVIAPALLAEGPSSDKGAVNAFLAAAHQHDPAIIALSSLMTTTMNGMKEVIDLLVSEGIRGRHKVIIGGAPITQQFADAIGADGYAEDAPRAVALANRLLAADRRTETS